MERNEFESYFVKKNQISKLSIVTEADVFAALFQIQNEIRNNLKIFFISAIVFCSGELLEKNYKTFGTCAVHKIMKALWGKCAKITKFYGIFLLKYFI